MVAGASLGNQRVGTSGRGTTLTAPNLPLADSPLFNRRALFLECCNRGIRVFPEISTLDDPTLSPSSRTQDDSHWQRQGICPLTSVSLPFYPFSRHRTQALENGLLVHPGAHTEPLGLCFSFLIHICLMDGTPGNYPDEAAGRQHSF